jgi:hypothetical protein
MLGFFLVALLWRAMFLPVSRGCYTDGILQIECFRYGMTYWPPLYALMARLVAWIPGVGLEEGGRLVALLAGALVVWPLGAMARRLFGLRGAFWAMAAWVVSPMALRWSVQPMTDMPMVALWTGALAALTIAVEHDLPGLFPDGGKGRAPNPRLGNQWLLLASALGALATLTRYQGILLLPLTLLAASRLGALRRVTPHRTFSPWWTQPVWLIVPLWALRKGMAPLANHFQQIGARAGNQGPFVALLHVYWNMFESFLVASPYFVAYGLFGFMLYGLLRTNWATARLRWTGWMALYLALAVLAVQSVFSSFQERYLLPLIPLVCLFAGHGMATWERRAGEGVARFWLVAGPALAHAVVFSALVGVFQGNPFLDIKLAARDVRDRMNLPADQRIVTNEFYNENIGAVKVNFWSGGHPAVLLGGTRLRAGDVILLSSFYAGGPEPYLRLLQRLKENPAIEQVGQPFGCQSVPLLPDLMPDPYNQNPMAWNLRYLPQSFQTTLLRVRNLSEEQLKNLAPIKVPTQGSRSRALMEQLKSVESQVDALQGTTPTLPRP